MKKSLLIIITAIMMITGVHTASAAILTVDSLLNTDDAVLNGVCDDGGGNCTLRAAITEAENISGADTIVLGISGTTETGVTPYDNITENLTITGSGQDFIIDGSNLMSGVFGITATVDFSYFSIINFSNTAFSVSTDNNVFSHMTLTGKAGNIAGCFEVGGNYNTFTYLTISNVGLGIRIWGDHNIFSDSVSHDNTHSGMTTYDGDYNQFLRNHIYNIGDRGMFNIFGSSHTIIQDNIIENNGEDGLVIGEVSPDDAESNTFLTITGNTFSGNAWSGIAASEMIDATISGNTITGNSADGITLDAGALGEISGTTTISGNTISDNTSNGVRVKKTTADFVIDSNTFATNGTNGVEFESNATGTATISDNTFTENTYYAITGGVNFTDSTITGNTISYTSGNAGIYLNGASYITIGGDLLADRNVIYSALGDALGDAITLSSVTSGIDSYFANNITIKNNYLNVDATGMISYPGNNAIATFSDGESLSSYTNIDIIDNLLNSTVSIENAGNVTIQGNTNGLASDGETLLNDKSSIKVYFGQYVTIGGIVEGQGNILVNNINGGGLDIRDSVDVEVFGNTIGFLADGITPLGAFEGAGVSVQSTTGLVLGGATSAHANIIASGADSFANLFIQTSTDVSVQGNFIGVGSDGVTKNTAEIGVLVANSTGTVILDNTITGINFGMYNAVIPSPGDVVIRNNTVFDAEIFGIFVGSSTLLDEGANVTSYASILGNSIYHNDGYGIAFGYDSDGDFAPDDLLTYLTNDSGDSDTGHNDYLNHPIIISATQSGLDTVVSYALDIPTSENPYRVEFFTNPTYGLHTSGYGEGEVYKTYANKTISSSGQQVFSATLSNVTATDGIAATITECLDSECTTFGATSRFSKWNDAIPDADPAPARGRLLGSGTHFIKKTNVTEITIATPDQILGSGTCSTNMIIHDNMKQGDRDGKYSVYNKNISREVQLLQSHINRILKAEYNQASGPEDGIFGKLTKQGVMRLQVVLNKILKPVKPLVIDGVVGPYTREAINHSCG